MEHSCNIVGSEIYSFPKISLNFWVLAKEYWTILYVGGNVWSKGQFQILGIGVLSSEQKSDFIAAATESSLARIRITFELTEFLSCTVELQTAPCCSSNTKFIRMTLPFSRSIIQSFN
jgi:hypothetical protein